MYYIIMNSNTKVRLFQIFKDDQVKNTNSFGVNFIFEMVEMLSKDSKVFIQSFQQIYLKIAKSGIKSNKKIPDKYLTVIKDLVEKLQEISEKQNTRKNIKQIPQQVIIQFYQIAIQLFSDLSRSTYLGVRIFGSKLLFTLLNSLDVNFLQIKIEPKILKEAIISTLILLRQKANNYKMLGIKISSVLQSLHVPALDHQIKVLVRQILKILSVDENQSVRYTGIKNLALTSDTLKDFILRLRDKSAQNRIMVYKKLITEKVRLDKLGLSNLYKVLYDGMSSRQVAVKNECIKYFAKYFETSKEAMQTQSKPIDFLRIFNPPLLLHYPHLYQAVSELVSKIIEDYSSKQFTAHFKSILQDLKKKNVNEEIFYIRVISNIEGNADANKNLLEQYFVSGLELAELLKLTFQADHYFQFNELIQLADKLINMDETGRNAIFDTCCSLLKVLKRHVIRINDDDFAYETDVCRRFKENEFLRMRILTNYYDQHIVHETDDLIINILRLMKKIRPQHFSIEVQQLISEINDENGDFDFDRRKKTTLQVLENLQKKQNSDDKIKEFKRKLAQIEQSISIIDSRSLRILLGLLQQTNNVARDLFVRVYQKNSQTPLGLLLMGLFALSSLENAKQYFPHIFKQYLQPTDENFALASIKVSTDLIIKFNLLRLFPSTQDYNPDLFLNVLSKYIFSKSPDIRVLAIESLCKILYNQKIDNPNLYFVYVLFLWWDTNTSENSSKSVHIISIFFKQYLEKSAENLQQISTLFQVYYSTLQQIENSKTYINKQFLKYTLKYNQFVKKTLQVLAPILKYERKDKSLRELPHLSKNQPNTCKIGPQQSFFLFMLQEKGFQTYIQTIYHACDFFNHTSVDILLLIKNLLDTTERFKGPWVRHLLSDLETILTVKGREQTTNYARLNEEFNQHIKQIRFQTKQVYKNIQQLGIIIKDYDGSEYESSEQSHQENSVISISSSHASRDQIKKKQSVSQDQSLSESVPKKKSRHFGQIQQQYSSQSSGIMTRHQAKKLKNAK